MSLESTSNQKTTDKKFLPATEVQSVQLRSWKRGVQIDVKKMERLLTVPRMRRDNPPTHLIVTVDGDFIRGNLIQLDDANLTFQEGLNQINIPRRTISVIIWLHDRTWKSPTSPAVVANKEEQGSTANVATLSNNASEPISEAPGPFKVYLKLRPAGRATMMPTHLTDGKLAGTNELLGEMAFPLKNIDQIALVGTPHLNPWEMKSHRGNSP